MAKTDPTPEAGASTSAPERPAPKGDGKLTELECALQTGNATPYKPGFARLDERSSTQIEVLDDEGRRVRYQATAEHAAAAQMHGWNLHDVAEPMRMTLDDYRAALVAASGPVTRVRGNDGKPVGQPLDAKAVAELKGRKPLVHTHEPHAGAVSPLVTKPTQQES